MINYTEEQLEQIKELRLLYISKMIGADEYKLSMAQINNTAKKAA